jgi:hypothetical protein
MKRTLVIVNDKMQRGYSYELSTELGKDFDPGFTPDLTPPELLRLGVFCGKYMTDCRGEFPSDWFEDAKLATSRRDCSLNYFGVDASQPLSEWRRKGWIYPDDPRGWSNGIADIIWAGECPRRMIVKSSVGKPCDATSGKFYVTASRAI